MNALVCGACGGDDGERVGDDVAILVDVDGIGTDSAGGGARWGHSAQDPLRVPSLPPACRTCYWRLGRFGSGVTPQDVGSHRRFFSQTGASGHRTLSRTTAPTTNGTVRPSSTNPNALRFHSDLGRAVRCDYGGGLLAAPNEDLEQVLKRIRASGLAEPLIRGLNLVEPRGSPRFR